jgi:hypothetical protein
MRVPHIAETERRRTMDHSLEVDRRTRRAIALGALLLALALVSEPGVLWAQGAGCAGTAIQFTSLDNLLKTAWEYLTSGAVIRIMAAAFIIAGVAGMIGRRPSVAIIGLLAGAVTAFVPTILEKLITQNTATALQICG